MCVCVCVRTTQVCQVLLSFWAFPKPLSWKYVVGGLLVTVALWWLQVRASS